MFQKIKDFLQTNLDNSNSNLNPMALNEQPKESQEDKEKRAFEIFIQSMKENENFPKKGISTLESMFLKIKEMDFQSLSIEEQILVRKIMEREIPHMIEVYLSLPKAHAVSFILENGKTSKDTLLDKLVSINKQLIDLWDNVVKEKTNLLIRQQKKEIQVPKAKIDFFDL